MNTQNEIFKHGKILLPSGVLKSDGNIAFSSTFEKAYVSDTQKKVEVGSLNGKLYNTLEQYNISDASVCGPRIFKNGKNTDTIVLQNTAIVVDLEASSFGLYSCSTGEFIKSFSKKTRTDKKIVALVGSEKDSIIFFAYENDSKVYSAYISADSCFFSPSMRVDLGFTILDKWKGVIEKLYCHPSKPLLFVQTTGGKVYVWNYLNLKKRMSKLQSDDASLDENEPDDDMSETASVMSGASKRAPAAPRLNKVVDIVPKMIISGPIEKIPGTERANFVAFDITGNLMVISWDYGIFSIYDFASVENPSKNRTIKAHSSGLESIAPMRTFMLNANLFNLSDFNSSNNVRPVACHGITFHPNQPILIAAMALYNGSTPQSFVLAFISLFDQRFPCIGSQDLRYLLPSPDAQPYSNSTVPSFTGIYDPWQEIPNTENSLISCTNEFLDIQICGVHCSVCSERVVLLVRNQNKMMAIITRFEANFKEKHYFGDVVFNKPYLPPDIFTVGEHVMKREQSIGSDTNAAGSTGKGKNSWPLMVTLRSAMHWDASSNCVKATSQLFRIGLGHGLNFSMDNTHHEDRAEESSNRPVAEKYDNHMFIGDLFTGATNSTNNWHSALPTEDLISNTATAVFLPKSIKVNQLAIDSGVSSVSDIPDNTSLGQSSDEWECIVRGQVLAASESDLNRPCRSVPCVVFCKYSAKSLSESPQSVVSSTMTIYRDADFWTGSSGTVPNDSNCFAVVLGANGMDIRYIQRHSNENSDNSSIGKMPFSYKLNVPMLRLWAAVHVGSIVYASEVNTNNVQTLYITLTGQVSINDKTNRLSLFPGEIVRDVCWQDVPSTMAHRLKSANETEKETQKLWQFKSEQLLGVLTNQRVLILNIRLVVLNEYRFSQDNSAREELRSIKSVFRATRKDYSQRSCDFVSSIMWVGSALSYLHESGQVSYLLPVRTLPEITGNLPNHFTQTCLRLNRIQVASFGSGNLCAVDNSLSKFGELRILACLPDRIIFLGRSRMTYGMNSLPGSANCGSLLMTTRPCIPAEPVLLSLLAASVSLGEGLNTKKKELLGQVLSAYVSSWYLNPNGNGLVLNEPLAIPSAHATAKICLALNESGFPALSAVVAGIPLFSQGNLPTFPSLRWLHSVVRFVSGASAGCWEGACVGILSAYEDIIEKFMDPDSYSSGSLPHKTAGIARQCEAISKILIVVGQLDLARKMADISGRDELLSYIISLDHANSSNVSASVQKPSRTSLNPLPSRLPLLGTKPKQAEAVSVSTSKKIPDDLIKLCGALDKRNKFLQLELEQIFKRVDADSNVSTSDSKDIYVINSGEIFNNDRRKDMFPLTKKLQVVNPLDGTAVKRSSDGIPCADTGVSSSGSVSSIQSIYDAQKKSFAEKRVYGKQSELGNLAMDSIEDWLGLKIKPEGLVIGSSSAGLDNSLSGSATHSIKSLDSSALASKMASINRPESWVDGVGTGKEHDKITGYWRFSDLALPGEESFASSGPPGARGAFGDLSKFSNPLEIFYEGCPSDVSIVESTSNVDPGEDHEKVKALNDILFSSGTAISTTQYKSGLRVLAGRGSSLDIGAFQSDPDRSKLTIELCVKVNFSSFNKDQKLILAERISGEPSSIRDIDNIIYSLFLTEQGFLQFSCQKGENGNFVTSSEPIPRAENNESEWVHLAVTVDSKMNDSAVSLFINGNRVAKETIGVAPMDESRLMKSTLYFCVNAPKTTRVTEIRCWAEARTSSEIEENKENYLSLASKRKRQQLQVKGSKAFFRKIRDSFALGDAAAADVKVVAISTSDKIETTPISSSSGGFAPPRPSFLSKPALDSGKSFALTPPALGGGSSLNNSSSHSSTTSSDSSSSVPASSLLPPRSPFLSPLGSGALPSRRTTLAPPISSKAIAVPGATGHSESSLNSESKSHEAVGKLSFVCNLQFIDGKSKVSLSDPRTRTYSSDYRYVVYGLECIKIVELGSSPTTSRVFRLPASLKAESVVLSPRWKSGDSEHFYVLTYLNKIIYYHIATVPSNSTSESNEIIIETTKLLELPMTVPLIHWMITEKFQLIILSHIAVFRYDVPSQDPAKISRTQPFPSDRPIKICDRNDVQDPIKYMDRKIVDVQLSPSGQWIAVTSVSRVETARDMIRESSVVSFYGMTAHGHMALKCCHASFFPDRQSEDVVALFWSSSANEQISVHTNIVSLGNANFKSWCAGGSSAITMLVSAPLALTENVPGQLSHSQHTIGRAHEMGSMKWFRLTRMGYSGANADHSAVDFVWPLFEGESLGLLHWNIPSQGTMPSTSIVSMEVAPFMEARYKEVAVIDVFLTKTNQWVMLLSNGEVWTI